MNPQLQGIDEIAGTYPFDVARSVERIRINRFFWSMTRPEYRERFVRDEAALCRAEGLTAEESAMVLGRDWLGLIRHGTNFFVLEKFARVMKTPNLVVYALMRGQSFEDFMQTRRVPSMR